MFAQEEAPNYTKQSHLFYFSSSFQVTHWPKRIFWSEHVVGATESRPIEVKPYVQLKFQ